MKKVSAHLGFTKNMGNFESLKIDIGFEDDVRPDESVEDAQERVYDVVEGELLKRLEEVIVEIEDVRKKGRR